MRPKLNGLDQGPVAVTGPGNSEAGDGDKTVLKLRQALPLRVNFTWTFFGNSIYALSQWAMLALLAKLGTPESVGQFALGLAVTAPIVIFASLSLRAVQATDARQTFEFGDYLALRLVTMLLAVALTIIVSFVGYQGEIAWIIVGVGLAKSVEALSDVYYGLLQQHEQMDRIAKSLIIKGPLSLIGLATGFVLTDSVIGGVAGLFIARLILLLAYDMRSPTWLARRREPEAGALEADVAHPRWQWRTLTRLAYLSLPLGVTTMLISLNTNLPRYFLERYWGAYELGIFAAMVYLFVAGGTIVNALGQSASPRLAKYYAGGEIQQFRRLLVRLVGIGLLLGVGALIVVLAGGRQILTILYQAEYAGFVEVLVWLTVAYTLTYAASFLGIGMTAARYFRVQPLIFGLITLFGLIFSYLLIPEYGMIGAALVAIGTAALQFVLAFSVNVHAFRALASSAIEV